MSTEISHPLKLAEWRSQEHEPTTEKQKKTVILDKLSVKKQTLEKLDQLSAAMWLGWVSTRTEGRASEYAIENEEIKELSTRKKLENCAVTHAVALLKIADTEETFEEYGLLGKS